MSQLGRLAWKSINTVISLQEQKQMQDNPEYGAAVVRLRVRQCLPSDVTLFNSRVIKSSETPDGVTLDSEEHFLASIIVHTNRSRQQINQWKAASVPDTFDSTRPAEISLIHCMFFSHIPFLFLFPLSFCGCFLCLVSLY